jgi:dimethylglycine dehydrogenase
MEHHYLVTEEMPEVAALDYELPMIRDTDSQYYLRQEGKGLLLGPWENDCRVAWSGESAPWSFGQELFANDLDRLEDGLAAIYHRVPALENAGIKTIVNGAISFAPDGRPIIGPMPGIPGFFVACGFLGGIAQGGGIGLAMSQWILNGEPELDLHFIDVARWGDWTSKEFARERTCEIFPRRYEIIYPGLERDSGRMLKTAPIHTDLETRGAVKLMPTRNSSRLSLGKSALCSNTAICVSTAARTASTTLGNSANMPSPMSLTMRPWCSAILGSVMSARRALRVASVPSSSARMRRE